LRQHKVDGVLVDQVSPAGGCVAEVLNLPLGIACNALALHQEPSVPPPVTAWKPTAGWLGRLRNRLGNQLLTIAAKPVTDEINAFRRRFGLPRWRLTVDQDFGLVQVAQQPDFFDFPRRQLPDHFHYTGPWHLSARDDAIPFPWEQLDGRPILFASLGTLQNRVMRLFAAVAEACCGLDLQLVLSLGRAGAELDSRLPRGAIVVPYAPQLPLLQRASAVVTHAGLNTALESLSCGLPMIAIPLTNDQPGVARRLVSLGVAELVPAHRASADRLRKVIKLVLEEPQYRAAAKRWQQQLRSCPTIDQTAALIDYALRHRVRLTRRAAADVRA
jgi:MGT family glycosyltransferase